MKRLHLRHPVWTGLAVVLVALILLIAFFDWNWLRGPVARAISKQTQREVSLDDLHVNLGFTTHIRMRGLDIGNTDWAKVQPKMIHAEQLEIDLRLLPLLVGKVELPQVSLDGADIALERMKDGRNNWSFGKESEKSGGSSVKLGALALARTHISYRDAVFGSVIEANAQTTDKGAPHPGLVTKIDLTGTYQGEKLAGFAWAGALLSLTDTEASFPLYMDMSIGQTKIFADGQVADIAKLSHIDAIVKVAGPSLSRLYPALKLALPTTPPYEIKGHLTMARDEYTFNGFSGKIGGSDISGDATFVDRAPRPLLTATLNSNVLDIADLGPLIGVKSQSKGTPPTTPTKVSSKPKKSGDDSPRVLPDEPFNLQRLNAMDAKVALRAKHIAAPSDVVIENLMVDIALTNGVLTLDPLRFGFAGGDIVATIALDAQKDPLKTKVALDFRRIKLSQLMPSLGKISQSGGAVGAQLRLAGQGDSVAKMLATSNGTVVMAMAGGEMSNLIVQAVALNGGGVIKALLGGDKQTRIRCAAAAFDVKSGVGDANTFVFDTENTRIGGDADFNFDDEQFNLLLKPVPKEPSILSLRAPVRIYGSFSKPSFSIDKSAIVRGVAAAALLAVVNPFAALLPLIETGQGEDVNCQALLAPVKAARLQAESTSKTSPSGATTGSKIKPAAPK